MYNKLLLPLAALACVASTSMAENYDTAVPASYHPVPQSFSYPYIGAAFGLAKSKTPRQAF